MNYQDKMQLYNYKVAWDSFYYRVNVDLKYADQNNQDTNEFLYKTTMDRLKDYVTHLDRLDDKLTKPYPKFHKKMMKKIDKLKEKIINTYEPLVNNNIKDN